MCRRVRVLAGDSRHYLAYIDSRNIWEKPRMVTNRNGEHFRENDTSEVS